MPSHSSTTHYGASYTQPGGGVTTCVNSVDVGSGPNRCVLVKHYRRTDRAIAVQSVTLGGESMVVLGSDVQLTGPFYARTFALVNPTVEGTQDLVITCTTNDSNSSAITVVSVYDGVDPNANEADLLVLVETDTVTTPWTSPYTAVVPSAAGELAVAMDFSFSNDVSCFLTASGFNERINVFSGGIGYATGDKAGEASATFTWTPSSLSQDLTVVHHGFSLPPVPAGGGPVTDAGAHGIDRGFGPQVSTRLGGWLQ